MSEAIQTTTTNFVVYYVSQNTKTGLTTQENYSSTPLLQTSEGEEAIALQQQVVQEYLNKEPQEKGTNLIGSFIEVLENRKNHRWTELHKALDLCRVSNATLLIAELGLLASNDGFTQTLLNAGVRFYCCDQPFVNQTILEALSKHALVQKKLHGKLIREGLKMTSAKSGNPNAAEVISKVNKPKIDTAIIFAFLLQPIINDYKRKGYSQRYMVKTLNEEGFTAPEGGKWVLSQLQKVLDRVRLNELATEFEPILSEFRNRGLHFEQMSAELNSKSVPALKRNQWDETQVKKLVERVQQIQEIGVINRFILNLLPIVHHYKEEGLTSREMLAEFKRAGIPIRRESPATV